MKPGRPAFLPKCHRLVNMSVLFGLSLDFNNSTILNLFQQQRLYFIIMGSKGWTYIVNIQSYLNKGRMGGAVWVCFEVGHWVHKELSPTFKHTNGTLWCVVLFSGVKTRIMQLREMLHLLVWACRPFVRVVCMCQSVQKDKGTENYLHRG